MTPLLAAMREGRTVPREAVSTALHIAAVQRSSPSAADAPGGEAGTGHPEDLSMACIQPLCCRPVQEIRLQYWPASHCLVCA